MFKKPAFLMKKPSANQPQEKENIFKTLLIAFALAIFIRSFFFEPFYIPSSSMKPNLLVGDYIFVSKYSYGYSRYSFPLGLNIFSGRVFENSPKRGDVAVFRLPKDPKINYVKRIIGLPGDKIQVTDGNLFINEEKISKISDGFFLDEDEKEIRKFIESLANKEIAVLDEYDELEQDNTGIFEVPENHYFMMGDNRDNSQDSRFLEHVGYIPKENLVGRAEIIFFSSSKPTWQVWNWKSSLRFSRMLKRII